MDDYVILLPALLTKKENEFRKLSHITCRITQDNIFYITNICNEIAEFCKSIGIPIERNNVHENPKCIQMYKYLSLNTNFKCLELLSQDSANTHLVDVCPLLSPYLFIEIIWRLQYEYILAESILYVPLDFAVEIIEAARRCIDLLPFTRALCFITTLVLNCFKKLWLIKTNGTQSADLNTNLDHFLTNISELLLVIRSQSFLEDKDFINQQRYHRTGLIIKSILDILISFLNPEESVTLNSALEKHYRVTFGFEMIHKCDENDLKTHFEALKKEMIMLTVNQIKNVNCHCYIDWAEIVDADNPTITLQKAIGLRCYKLLEIIRQDDELKENEAFLNCVQQISSEPDPELATATLPLDVLIAGAENSNQDYINEIFNRCQTWDEVIFEKIKKLKIIPNTNICLKLLDYLVYLRSDPQREAFQHKIYCYTMLLMLKLENSETENPFIQTIILFILKHNGSDILENPSTKIEFDKLISRKPFEAQKNIKVSLLCILKNPKKYLKLFLLELFLTKSTFTLSSDDIVWLLPFMDIKDRNDHFLFFTVMKELYMTEMPLDLRMTNKILKIVFEALRGITAHGFVNSVLIPYLLLDNYPQKNLNLVLTQISHYWTNSEIHENNIHYGEFLQGLAKKISFARKDNINPKYDNCHIISTISNFVIQLKCRKVQKISKKEKRVIWELVKPILEPLDVNDFATYGLNLQYNISINRPFRKILNEYEARYFGLKHRILNDAHIKQNIKNMFEGCDLMFEDFIRHAILHCCRDEFDDKVVPLRNFLLIEMEEYLVEELAVEVFVDIIRLIIEACMLCLEYPNDFAFWTFPMLLTVLIDYWIREFRWYHLTFIDDCEEEILEMISNVVPILRFSITGTPYSDAFDILMRDLKEAQTQQATCLAFKNFATNCTEGLDKRAHRYEFQGEHSVFVKRFRYKYNIINASMMYDNSQIVNCLVKAQQCLLDT